MTDPKHAWPPPHAAHRRRGGAHRAVVVHHPRRVGSVAAGLLGVAVVVTMAATFTPSAPVGAAVPPAQAAAAPSGRVPMFEMPASSGGVVVWPVRQVVDTDPITDTTTASVEATTSADVPETTVPATTEGTADPVDTPAPTTTQAPAPHTHRPRPTPAPTPTLAPTPVSCSPGGAA